MKRKIGIVAIVLFTIFCIYLGVKTRKDNAINVTQIQTNNQEALSYMLKTKNNYIVMIDGGNYEDSEHLEDVLMQNGGVVTHWYITLAHNQNFGALQKIIEKGNIKVENVYISFNDIEWYKKYESDRVLPILEFLSVMDEKKQNYAEIPANYEIEFDGWYITVLNWKNPEFNGEYAGFNQSMILKINNMYKSVIFMGNSANQAGEFFKDNHLDELKCDAVQVSNNGSQFVNNEIYQKMKPKYLLISVPVNTNQVETQNYGNELKNILNSKEVHFSNEGDKSLVIW